MRAFLLLLVLISPACRYAHAQHANSNGGSNRGHRARQPLTGRGHQLQLGTTEDGQEGYHGAYGGQGAFPFWGGAGAGPMYADGGQRMGIGQGIGSGSVFAYQQRLRTGQSDRNPEERVAARTRFPPTSAAISTSFGMQRSTIGTHSGFSGFSGPVVIGQSLGGAVGGTGLFGYPFGTGTVATMPVMATPSLTLGFGLGFGSLF